MYLWPTEEWWPGHERQFRNFVGSRHHFGIVALKDGRFATDGTVYGIEKNKDCYGRPCVYGTRTQALRVAAARAITLARASREWTSSFDRLQGEHLAAVINWYREIVARESGKPAPKPVTVPEPPPPPAPRPEEGLPLFESRHNAPREGSAAVRTLHADVGPGE
jgi:uncharacterized protein (DUF433 family)